MNLKKKFEDENAELIKQFQTAQKKRNRNILIVESIVGTIALILTFIIVKDRWFILLLKSIGSGCVGFFITSLVVNIFWPTFSEKERLNKKAKEFIENEVLPALLKWLQKLGYTLRYSPGENPLDQELWIEHDGSLIRLQNMDYYTFHMTKDGVEYFLSYWQLLEGLEEETEVTFKIIRLPL